MTRNRFAELAQSGLEQEADPAPAPEIPAAPEPGLERTRMLGGRVPEGVFREFGHAKLDAEAELRLHRITTEEAVEALVRTLRDPQGRARWHAELRAVRERRRG